MAIETLRRLLLLRIKSELALLRASSPTTSLPSSSSSTSTRHPQHQQHILDVHKTSSTSTRQRNIRTRQPWTTHHSVASQRNSATRFHNSSSSTTNPSTSLMPLKTTVSPRPAARCATKSAQCSGDRMTSSMSSQLDHAGPAGIIQ